MRKSYWQVCRINNSWLWRKTKESHSLSITHKHHFTSRNIDKNMRAHDWQCAGVKLYNCQHLDQTCVLFLMNFLLHYTSFIQFEKEAEKDM